MKEQQIDIHLFSSSSLDIYPNNKLASFTCKLENPLRLNPNDKYQVALTEIHFPDLFESNNEMIGKDSIIFGTKNYPSPNDDLGLKKCLDIILSFNTTDPSIYNLDYFAPFLDENLIFNKNTLEKSSLSKYGISSPLPSNFELSSPFDLRLADLLDTKRGETSELFIPDVHVEEISYFFEEGQMNFPLNIELTMNEILYSFIYKIYKKMSIHARKAEIQEKYYKDLLKKENPEQLHKMYREKVNKLIHRFIKFFVATTIEICEKMLKDKPQQKLFTNNDYILVFCDACVNSLIGNSSAKVLRVLDRKQIKSSGFISNPSYITVDKTIIQDISIILTNLEGSLIQFSPSFTPTHVCLRFRKFKQ